MEGWAWSSQVKYTDWAHRLLIERNVLLQELLGVCSEEEGHQALDGLTKK